MGIVNGFPKGKRGGQEAKAVYAPTRPAHENYEGINSRVITHDPDSFAAENEVSLTQVRYKPGLRDGRC